MCDIVLIIILMHQNMSLSTIRLEKCVTNLLMLIVLQYNFFMNAAKTQKKMCDKAAYTCPFVFDSAPDQDKVQEMCVKLFPKNF